MKNFKFVFLYSILTLVLSSCSPTPEEPLTLNFSEDSVFLKIGDLKELKLESNKSDFNYNDVTYTYDSTIVSYTNNVVTGLSYGKTNLVASYNNITATSLIYVLDENNPNVTLSETETILDVNETSSLYIFKNGEVYENVYWISEDVSVCEITNQGEIKGIKPGKTNIRALVNGEELSCVVKVFGVDGDISDWYLDDQLLYKSASLSDIYNEEIGFTVFGRYTNKGLYVGGFATHTLYIENAPTWYLNTNFEMFVNINGVARQFYASPNVVNPNAVSNIKTILNPNPVSNIDIYLSTFEIYVPLTPTLIYYRASFAFKTPGDKISFMVGGDNPTVNVSDWWWMDLHYPSNLNEMWYIYEDGLYEEEIL